MRTAAALNMVTEAIIGCQVKVHNVLGSGFAEKVYANALAHELRRPAFRCSGSFGSRSGIMDLLWEITARTWSSMGSC